MASWLPKANISCSRDDASTHTNLITRHIMTISHNCQEEDFLRQLNCCAALRTKQDVDPNVFFGSSLSFNLYTLLSTRSAAVKKRKLRTIKVAAATFCVNAHTHLPR